MNTSPHVVYPDQVAPYQPANHTGTSNRRIIGRDTVGARRLEVLIGTISKGHGAQRHAHPSLEQASYLLRGAGVSEVYGQERHLSAGDWGFSPKGVFHSFTVTSEEPAQVLVVYAPPYQENPRAVVVHNPAHPQPEPRPPVTTAVAPVPVCWEGTEGARVETIVDTATAGAQHLAIHRVVAVAGAHGRARQLENQERVLYVLEGAVEGQADQRAFEARRRQLGFRSGGGRLAVAIRPGGLDVLRDRWVCRRPSTDLTCNHFPHGVKDAMPMPAGSDWKDRANSSRSHRPAGSRVVEVCQCRKNSIGAILMGRSSHSASLIMSFLPGNRSH